MLPSKPKGDDTLIQMACWGCKRCGAIFLHYDKALKHASLCGKP